MNGREDSDCVQDLRQAMRESGEMLGQVLMSHAGGRHLQDLSRFFGMNNCNGHNGEEIWEIYGRIMGMLHTNSMEVKVSCAFAWCFSFSD